ncbi:MAG: hypothetical protein JWO10_2100 [Microbacteriaceae bacterium]|nr:hypothetical protein [Microbacteriaceae bacterium]
MFLSRRRSIGAVCLALMTVTVLAACSMDQLFPEAGPTGTAAPGLAYPAAVGSAAPTIDSNTVPGINGQRIFSADGGTPLAARWAYLPGEQVLNAAIDGRVSAALAAFAGGTYSPRLAPAPVSAPDRGACVRGSTVDSARSLAADASEAPAASGVNRLLLSCDALLASGQFFGERMRVLTIANGEATADTSVALYTDTAAATVFDGGALVSDAGRNTVVAWVIRALVTAKRADAAAETESRTWTVAQQNAFLADVAFRADGDLVVTVPAEFGRAPAVAPVTPAVPPATPPATPSPTATATSKPAERLAQRFVAVSVDRVTNLLSEAGARVQAAVMGGAAYTGPADVPAPLDHLNCAIVACMALTFDDGPGPYTDDLIGTLKAKNASATFFMVGRNAEAYPSLVQRVSAAGQEIGNHSWSHPELTKLSDADIRSQVDRTSQAIFDAIGRRPALMRPPYGDENQRVRDDVELPLVLWDVDPKDWTEPPVDQLLDRTINGPRIGSILLMHDVHKPTVEHSGEIIDGLRARGFSFATITQLMRGQLPPAGTVISHGER